MKKILFILHFPPPVHGSSLVGQSIRNSKIINNTFECCYINLLVSRKLNETGKPSLLKLFRFIGLWFKTLREIIKKKPDVCYLALTATNAAFYKDLMLVVLLHIFKIKRVYHLHNKGVSNNQTNRINRLFYSYVFKNADIILLSKLLYKDIETFVPASNLSICHNGILDTNINFVPRIHQNEKPVKILFLSNLIESKGVFILLEACSILKQKGIDFECDFIGDVGDIDARQFKEKVNQMHLSSRVKYLGKKYDAEKKEVFANAEIFAFPTLNDCFPLVLLEAMCDGLPIVSTYEGGISDIVDDGVTGYLVPKQNVPLLADRLEVLVKDPLLRQTMGKAGRLKYEREFTIEIFEQRLSEILVKI